MRLTQIIEALLFASDAPLTAADLARIDERLDEDTVTAVIEELRGEYDLSERSFQIYEVAGGFQLLTRPEFLTVLERYDTVPQASRLSTPALEVLAIIAYRQPIGRSEIEEIRGVQSAAVLRTLQDRYLVDAVGRSEALGRPLLYGTTAKFLEHFGFRSLEELPRPDELPVVLKTRSAVSLDGTAAPAPEGTAVAPSEPAAAGTGTEDTSAEPPTDAGALLDASSDAPPSAPEGGADPDAAVDAAAVEPPVQAGTDDDRSAGSDAGAPTAAGTADEDPAASPAGEPTAAATADEDTAADVGELAAGADDEDRAAAGVREG
jgi:segregation and condensation protein B